MKIKSINKLICNILALIFIFNPLISVADTLFSAFGDSNSSSQMLSTEGNSGSNCHEQENLDSDSLMTKSDIKHSDMDEDCCEDVCHCVDSGCHGVSLPTELKPLASYSATQDNLFGSSLYLSLASAPSSPPPIV